MRRTTLLGTCAVLALLQGGCQADGGARDAVGTQAPGVAAFSGRVEAIDNGCFADGVCSVTVAGRRVVTLRGWSRATWGMRDPDLAVGDRVDVRCRETDDGCTLEGDADSYVR